MAREGQSATGLPGGIAIPHCRSPYVDSPSIGFARLDPAVDFGAPDGPADLVFLIAAPDSGGAEHMKLLSSLARVAGAAGVRPVAARRIVGRRRGRPGRRGGQPGAGSARRGGSRARGRRRCAGRAETPRCRDEVDRRDHRLPHRHRAHLHGRRRPETGRRARGGRTSWSRPRAPRAAHRWPPPRSPAPTPSSSPPTSASRTGAVSPASR